MKKQKDKNVGYNFEYRSGRSVISGNSGDPKVMKLAETEQRNRLIRWCGGLVVCVLALVLNIYPEYLLPIPIVDYLKSIIFKAH